MLNINITICDRPYRLKVRPEEEETVRKAARTIAEKIKELQNQYSGSDKQDYLAMLLLTTLVEQQGKNTEPATGDTSEFLTLVDKLNRQVTEALHR